MAPREPAVRTGCAGWSLPRAAQPGFGGGASHLQRYPTRLSLVEINSSFYRPHRREVYARWAGQVPEGFAFAVKLPRIVTHDKRLADCQPELDTFVAQANGLGPAFAAVLVQLPPSLPLDEDTALGFVAALRQRFQGGIERAVSEGRTVWCVFDNTAAGAAASNALSLAGALRKERP